MEDKIKCTHAKEQLLEEIQEGITSEGFELFLEKHTDCKEELLSFYDTVLQLDGMEREEPSAEMDQKFYEMLSAEPTHKLVVKRPRQWLRNLAVAASIFMVGALAGFYFFGDSGNQQMRMAEKESIDNENLMLASNSSMTRLEDISEMRNAPKLNDKIIDALNRALVNDPNVNVRLSAIEAMLHYADNPRVRENLIKAIPYQDSPIIQMTLAEVMISLEESDSKDEWLELFNSGKMEDEMKEQLEKTLAPVLKL